MFDCIVDRFEMCWFQKDYVFTGKEHSHHGHGGVVRVKITYVWENFEIKKIKYINYDCDRSNI